ncbi:MAG: M50 family metallopeptidase [Pirellulaceae bacterium]
MRIWSQCAYLLLWAWLCMTLLHELGHIAVGCAAGGNLSGYELRPWHLPRSLFSTNPHPLLTLWAGPILGCTVLLLAAAATKRTSLWLVAWFSVVANGLYLLLGYYAGDSELDSIKIIQAGTPTWIVLVVGTVMTVAGYAGFRGESRRWLATNAPPIAKRTLAISAGVLACLVVLLAIFGTR